MSMYLWLKKGSEGAAKSLVGTKVGMDEVSGSSYVYYHVDACDPTCPPPSQELMALVERVTLRDSIHRGLRKDGVYHRDGCELVAKTEFLVSNSHGDPDIENQTLSISGPTVEAVENMYSLFREGKLGEPDVNWEPPNARPTQSSETCQLLRKILTEIVCLRMELAK